MPTVGAWCICGKSQIVLLCGYLTLAGKANSNLKGEFTGKDSQLPLTCENGML
jgi:hypothetical protein